MTRTLSMLVVDPGFIAGLLSGLAAVVGLTLWRRPIDVLLVGAVASAVGMAFTALLDPAVAIAMVLAALLMIAPIGHTLRALVAGLLILVTTAAPDVAESPWMVGLVMVGVAATVRAAHDWPRPRVAAPLVAITVVGVWATIPDTDALRVMVGVMIAVVVVPMVMQREIVTPARMLAPLAVLLGGLILDGGDDRFGSIVGSVGTLGMLAIGERFSLGPMQLAVRSTRHLIGAHVVLVVTWSRLAGLQNSTLEALTIGLPVTIVVLALVLRPANRHAEQIGGQSR